MFEDSTREAGGVQRTFRRSVRELGSFSIYRPIIAGLAPGARTGEAAGGKGLSATPGHLLDQERDGPIQVLAVKAGEDPAHDGGARSTAFHHEGQLRPSRVHDLEE